ncbi:MAG: GyrI-like domain-containing protein [Actinomycetota bacterium]
MEKLDLKRQLREFYGPSAKQCSVVDVPEWQFLMVDGAGDPNTSQAYSEAIEALYAMSYTLKFMSKNVVGVDYTVMALEGLWWVDDMAEFSMDDKSAWKWTAMILQPDHISDAHVTKAAEEARRKKDLPALDLLRLEALHEGLAVQIMHVGPYSDEPPTIERLHQFASEQGYRLRGKHHEIYLSDPRRTAPEKLRTVIRQPVVLRGGAPHS